MENSDRPEKRRKYVAMKILSVAGAVLSPLLALAFLASSVFSLIANSLGEPGYFDYGVPLRGVSCAACVAWKPCAFPVSGSKKAFHIPDAVMKGSRCPPERLRRA